MIDFLGLCRDFGRAILGSFGNSRSIPSAVRNFLMDTGYDSYVALRTMTDDDLNLLEKQYKLLPGHRTALAGYRKLVKDNNWATLVNKLTAPSKGTFFTAAEARQNSRLPNALTVDEVTKLNERFKERLIQWLMQEEPTKHNVSGKDFIIKQIKSVDGDIKFGTVCPFCQPEKVMLFYTKTSNSSFRVTTSNYAKHYVKIHRLSLSVPSGPSGSKQVTLEQVFELSKEKHTEYNVQSGDENIADNNYQDSCNLNLKEKSGAEINDEGAKIVVEIVICKIYFNLCLICFRTIFFNFHSGTFQDTQINQPIRGAERESR